MKKTVLLILTAIILLSTFGCNGITVNNIETTQTEEVTTEDPTVIYKRKIHNRIASDADSVLKNDGISPGNVFFMSYSEAISRFVKNKRTTIYSCEEAEKSGALSNAEKRSLLNNSDGLTTDNIFIYQITGRTMKNPTVEYLLTDETTILRIALAYDDNANYVGYLVLEVNDSLNTCVIIAVTRF